VPPHQPPLIVPLLRGSPSTLDGPRWPLFLIVGLTAWRLLVAGTVPVTQDEAYYFDWAQSLAWGYFDHPPGVALLGILTRLEPGSVFVARLGAVLAGTLTLLILWRFYRACGLRRGRDLLLALTIAAGTLPGLISGVITTPDTVLILCWSLALHASLAALQGRRRHWLTAGIATGLGLLGKYTMVVIGPVFLWAILIADPRALRGRWPYLGGLLALLIFLPNILWNADNDWLTMRFQFGHGFSTDTGMPALTDDPLPAVIGAHAYAASAPAPMQLSDRLSSLGSYLASQLLFWGLLLVPLIAAPFAAGGVRRLRSDLSAAFDRPARTLLAASILFPLAFFAAVALISDVEPNWSALYLIAAAPVAAVAMRPIVRWAVLAVALNLLLVSLYALHAATALLPLPHAAERIMRETHGYDALTAHVATLPGPYFADRYPFAAMLNFHRPGLEVAQWPGITRPSEYERGQIAPIPSLGELEQSGFWLVSRKFTPPTIPGFVAVETQMLFDCAGEPLRIVQGDAGFEHSPCGDQWQHVWRIYRYVAAANTTAADSD
jgi:4-amino-4-deoxy-L-arabinose transferase-like glycosyltransferase